MKVNRNTSVISDFHMQILLPNYNNNENAMHFFINGQKLQSLRKEQGKYVQNMEYNYKPTVVATDGDNLIADTICSENSRKANRKCEWK